MLAPSLQGVRVSRVAKPLAVFAMGVVTGSVLIGWSPHEAAMTATIQAQVQQVSDRCIGGDEVSSFVCRNTWMAQNRYTYR